MEQCGEVCPRSRAHPVCCALQHFSSLVSASGTGVDGDMFGGKLAGGTASVCVCVFRHRK